MTAAVQPRRRRRWLQFSLRTVLILTAVIAAASAWGNRIAARYAARQRIEKLPVAVEIEAGPPWIGRWFGGEIGRYFDQVRALDFSKWDDLSSTPEASLEHAVPTLLKDIGRQTGLRKLDLTNAYVLHDDGLVPLEGLDELEELSLGGTNVTDEGLRHLGGLTKL